MNTSVKNIFATVVLTASAFAGRADEIKPASANTAYSNVISKFMDSYKNNDLKLMTSVLSEDASYKYNRAERVQSHSAKALLKFVKENQGTIYQNCKQNVRLVSQSDALVIAKIELNAGENNASD